MKLTIKRLELLKLLSAAIKAVPSQSAERNYTNFLIICKDEKLTIITSDGEIVAKVEQGLNNKKGEPVITNIDDGALQVDARTFYDIVSKLDGETISLQIVDTSLLNISDENTQFNIKSIDANEYPDVNFEIPEETKKIVVKSEDLKHLFDTTSFAVANKGPKSHYFGINISFANGKMTFLATDTYRMACNSIKIDNKDCNFKFTCPVKALSMVTSIIEGDCEIYFDNLRAIFKTNDVMITTRLLSGEFPSISKMIDQNFCYTVEVSASEFLSASERVKIITAVDGKTPRVKLTLSTQTGATLSARSSSFGNSSDTLKSAKFTLPEGEYVFEIVFNADFVASAIKALESETFRFEFISPINLFLVRGEDENNIQILTPIRLSTSNS